MHRDRSLRCDAARRSRPQRGNAVEAVARLPLIALILAIHTFGLGYVHATAEQPLCLLQRRLRWRFHQQVHATVSVFSSKVGRNLRWRQAASIGARMIVRPIIGQSEVVQRGIQALIIAAAGVSGWLSAGWKWRSRLDDAWRRLAVEIKRRIQVTGARR